MKILGIETSCDETSASVIEENQVLSNVISSQMVHLQFGGVVPELASRAHLRKIIPVVESALEQANCTFADIDAIAVTHGPGLIGALSDRLGVPRNFMFIGTPGDRFPHRIEHLGGVRLIL